MSNTARIVEMSMNREFSARCFPGQILQTHRVSAARPTCGHGLPFAETKRPRSRIYGNVIWVAIEEAFGDKCVRVIRPTLLEGDCPGRQVRL